MTAGIARRVVLVLAMAGTGAVVWFVGGGEVGRRGREPAGAPDAEALAPESRDPKTPDEVPGGTPEAKPLRVVVRAFPEGEPIAGAVVELRKPWPVETIDRGVADASGEASLREPPDDHVVWASADGFVAAELAIGAGDRSVVLALRRGLLRRGRVVHAATRDPMAGVRVTVDEEENWVRLAADAISDARGEFGLPTLPRDRLVELFLSKDGLWPVRMRHVAPASGDLEAAMGAAGTVDVRVRAAPDVDPRGVAVWVVSLDSHAFRLGEVVHALVANSWEPDELVGRAIAGDDGLFRVEGVPVPGDYAVLARAPGFREGHVRELALTAAAPRRAVEVTLGLAPRVRLRVVDPDGAPIGRWVANATPRACRREADALVFASSGRHDVSIVAPGFLPRVVSLVAAEHAREPVELRLDRGLSLSGVVTGPDGAQVEGVSVVYVRRVAGDAAAEVGEDVSDGHGRFRISALESGTGRLNATDPRGRFAAGGAEGVAAGGPDVAIRLLSAAACTGRLVPVPPTRRILIARDAIDLLADLEVDDLGRFLLRGLPVGEAFDLRLVPDRGRPLLVVVPKLAAGEVRDLGDIPIAPGITLRGRLVDRARRPIAAATVYVSAEGFVDRTTITDRDGAFRFDDLPEAAIQLDAEAEGFIMEPLDDELPLTQSTVLDDFVLDRAANARLAIVDADGRPVPSLRIQLNGLDRSWNYGLETNDRGRAELDVFAGRYRVVRYEGRGEGAEEVALGEVELREGPNEEMRFVRR